ncbi:MAG TPA: AMP-binding protein [Myxococcaceae bacterium]|jgi:acyl-CoA synthetase (AMP-forming)/AMP-acid ligase II
MNGSHGVQTLHGAIASWARSNPGSTAIAAPGRRPLSYEALDRQVRLLGARLRGAGLRRGDRVAVAIPNGPELAVALLGASSAAACVPLNLASTAPELSSLYRELEIRALLTTEGDDQAAALAARSAGIQLIRCEIDPGAPAGALAPDAGATGAAEVPDAMSGDDVACALQTSGTTARPKMLPWTHRNLVAFGMDIARRLSLRPDDVSLNVMPLFHSHGLFVSVIGAVMAGGAVACTPGFVFAPEFFSWLEECRPTWYTAVPTVHEAILAHAADNADVLARHRLRFIRSASSSLAPKNKERLEATFGVPLVETYGLTEVVGWLSCTGLPGQPGKPRSVGQPGPEVAIMNDRGALLPPGQVGEIVVRGETRAVPYLGEPLRLVDGWYRTGDAGLLDGDGFLFITGRLKEMINRGGEKISPQEVDDALLRHPGVAAAVSFGVAAPAIGEEVEAAVVLGEGVRATSAELREFVAAHLAPFKVPRRIFLVKELPKGATGKLRRTEVATLLRGNDDKRPAGDTPQGGLGPGDSVQGDPG